jgi:hypothetical protein
MNDDSEEKLWETLKQQFREGVKKGKVDVNDYMDEIHHVSASLGGAGHGEHGIDAAVWGRASELLEEVIEEG